MPKKRPPRDVWKELRRQVWERDHHRCVRCLELGIDRELTLDQVHIDHHISGKRGTNQLANLRTLCRMHHVLRADFRHRGMIAKALRDGIIPANWRELVWEG